MALRDLIEAAQRMEAARQRIEELKSERQRNQDRNAAIGDLLVAARAEFNDAKARVAAEIGTVLPP